MKNKIINIVIILSFILSTTTYSQEKNIELANNHFNHEEYHRALIQYQRALHKNRLLHRADKYEYFFLLFQIAESKRHLNDTTCNKDYQRIIDKHSKIEWPDNLKLDNRVLLFVAESNKNLRNFSNAEDYYKQASINMDSIPDFFKLGYAFCSLKQNRFGQSLMLLSEIKDNVKFEPSFSQFSNICKVELDKSITSSIELKDSLVITMNYQGCNGGISYKFVIFKLPEGYQLISYESKSHYRNEPWERQKIQTIDDSVYYQIINFEKELRNYNQYTNKISCTVWADFLIETKNDKYKIEITDCAIGVGYDLREFLSKK
jgi:tetratricopeptide (TPR) repeat protein